MRKNKSKQLLLAALAGLLLLSPVHGAHAPQTVHAAPNSSAHDSRLSAFDIAPGVLSPAFSPDIFEYTSVVEADVTSVSVQAVPRASTSVIASVDGRDGLRPGINTIKVVCSAQDNSSTTYTITLTVGSADAGTQPETGAADGDAQGAAGMQPGDGTAGSTQDTETKDTELKDAETKDTQAKDTGTKTAKKKKAKKSKASALIGKVADDGTVTLNGAAYKLSSNFTYGTTTQDIPSAFGEGSLQIGSSSYNTLYCASGSIHLVYMENTDGKGSTGFYYYDEKQNVAERFKYAGIGDNFVVFISSAREEVPAGFTETTLTLPSGKEAAAYQNASLDEAADYYLIYGVNSDGTHGWYLYDNSQGTYMRYANVFATQPQEEEDGEEEVERTVSLTKYNSLNEKYTELKENRVKLVSIFVIVILVLIIIFTAVLLRSQDDGDDEDEEDEREARARKRAKNPKKKTGAVSKSSLAAGRDFEGSAGKRAKKITKHITREPEPEGGFHGGIATPEMVRAQAAREKEQGAKPYGKPSGGPGPKQGEPKAFAQKPGYGQPQMEQNAYEQKLREQKAYSQPSGGPKPKAQETKAYGQQLNDQSLYEQKLKEQLEYEQKAYEKQLKERRAQEQQRSGQGAYMQQPGGQPSFGREQAARAQAPGFASKPGGQVQEKAYGPKPGGQTYEPGYGPGPGGQSYEHRAAAQRPAMQGAGMEMPSPGAREDVPVSLLRKSDPAGPQDSVQLAAERMRQSMRFAREVPKTGTPEPGHDPMDDWDMEEDSGRRQQKAAKAAKKKRRSMDDEMEIMDLNDL